MFDRELCACCLCELFCAVGGMLCGFGMVGCAFSFWSLSTSSSKKDVEDVVDFRRCLVFVYASVHSSLKLWEMNMLKLLFFIGSVQLYIDRSIFGVVYGVAGTVVVCMMSVNVCGSMKCFLVSHSCVQLCRC